MDIYEPLYTLKKVDENIWTVDGELIHLFKMPFPTRMTIIRLKNNDLFLHSPIHLTEKLKEDIIALGNVKHLVSPNWLHYAYIKEWTDVFKKATSWASPNVIKRAHKTKNKVQFDKHLSNKAESEWSEEINQLIVKGSRIHQEVVFFHYKSKTLVLTDLLQNYEPSRIPYWFKIIAKVNGLLEPDAQMPRDLRLTFIGNKQSLVESLKKIISWNPERVILSHGRWYESNGTYELKRAFRKLL